MTGDGDQIPPDQAIYEGIRSAGIRTVLSLPDSVLFGVAARAEQDPQTRHLVCTREDEGLAIAAGAFLGGELCAVLMEGSGVGYSGLILARMLLQRTGALILASHNRVFGESRDYHAASRLAGEGVLAGLGVPYATLTSRLELPERVRDAAVTAAGQRQPVALLVSPTVTLDRPGSRRAAG
jgi:sulfopyruvate decarboxylase TPP-binding subunit